MGEEGGWLREVEVMAVEATEVEGTEVEERGRGDEGGGSEARKVAEVVVVVEGMLVEGWIMVADATSGNSTYGSGRYMYIDLPEKNGKIQLDFNYLYNPPCSYSEFTTCLLPPLQNRLPFPIEAGELLALKK